MSEREPEDFKKVEDGFLPRVLPGEVEPQSERVYCADHKCWLVQDAYGNWICYVCVVEDRLDL